MSSQLQKAARSSHQGEVSKDTMAPLTKPKITERVDQLSSSEQTAPVAQRVVLYDEEPNDLAASKSP